MTAPIAPLKSKNTDSALKFYSTLSMINAVKMAEKQLHETKPTARARTSVGEQLALVGVIALGNDIAGQGEAAAYADQQHGAGGPTEDQFANDVNGGHAHDDMFALEAVEIIFEQNC